VLNWQLPDFGIQRNYLDYFWNCFGMFFQKIILFKKKCSKSFGQRLLRFEDAKKE
jgi:fucose 4-O-acetylase-like acetyltransferase